VRGTLIARLVKRKQPVIRIAAAGDVHGDEGRRQEIAEAFAAVNERADLLLLAGDITTYGEPEQAAVVADASRSLEIPVVAVLGNHDWHADRGDDITDVLESAGVTVLHRGWTVRDVRGTEVGIVGTKGFVGGFPDSALPDFGEPLLRQIYTETTNEVSAIEHGLQAIAHCPVRIVLLHYAPTMTTLEGEPRGILAFLGSDRLARPIAEQAPDLVIHGHGHAGSFEGYIGSIPVFNVSLPVMGHDFWVFELDGSKGGLRHGPV
jgi:Icc-related predicted phosphoesterase